MMMDVGTKLHGATQPRQADNLCYIDANLYCIWYVWRKQMFYLDRCIPDKMFIIWVVGGGSNI